MDAGIHALCAVLGLVLRLLPMPAPLLLLVEWPWS